MELGERARWAVSDLARSPLECGNNMGGMITKYSRQWSTDDRPREIHPNMVDQLGMGLASTLQAEER